MVTETVTPGQQSHVFQADVARLLHLMVHSIYSERDIFLRADFEDLGGYDQVGVVLRQLVRAGKLLKISKGMYARAEPSIIDGRPVPAKDITDRKSTRLNSSHVSESRMPSSA